MGDKVVARPLPTHRPTQTQNKHKQISTTRVEFELATPVFERAKAVHALYRAVTVCNQLASLDNAQKIAVCRSDTINMFLLKVIPFFEWLPSQGKTKAANLSSCNILTGRGSFSLGAFVFNNYSWRQKCDVLVGDRCGV
jgi:hypothetical protein